MNFYWVVGRIDSGEIPLSKPDSNYCVELIMLVRQMRLRYRLIYVHIRAHTIYGRSRHSPSAISDFVFHPLKSERREFFPTIESFFLEFRKKKETISTNESGLFLNFFHFHAKTLIIAREKIGRMSVIDNLGGKVIDLGR